MDCGQHTAQSKQPVSGKILPTRHLYTNLLQDLIDRKCSTPWEREGFSKTDSTQYCNSRDTQNQEGAQLLAAPPMCKIQQKWKQQELFKPHRQEQGMKLKTRETGASRRMKQEETQKQSKLFCSKSSALYFAFMNIVLQFHKQVTALQNSKLRMHLKQDLVLTQRVSPCKVEIVLTISGPKLPH